MSNRKAVKIEGSVLARWLRSIGIPIVLASGLGLWGTENRVDAMSYWSSTNNLRRTLSFYFAASRSDVAFPVVAPDNRIGLLLLDLQSRKRRLLVSKEGDLISPFLSTDGNRLIFVRQPRARFHELVSCEIANWSCRILLKTENTIFSPIELGRGKILFSSSPLIVGHDGKARYSRHDIWLLNSPSLQKLSDLQFYELNALSLTRDHILFSAAGHARGKPIIPEPDALAKSDSDIFQLPFDRTVNSIATPNETLVPLFKGEGRSTRASADSEGNHFAFLNTNTSGNYKYDLIVVDTKDGPWRRIASTGLGFSVPVVLQDIVCANELFAEKNVVECFDIRTGERKFFEEFEVAERVSRDVDLVELQAD